MRESKGRERVSKGDVAILNFFFCSPPFLYVGQVGLSGTIAW